MLMQHVAVSNGAYKSKSAGKRTRLSERQVSKERRLQSGTTSLSPSNVEGGILTPSSPRPAKNTAQRTPCQTILEEETWSVNRQTRSAHYF